MELIIIFAIIESQKMNFYSPLMIYKLSNIGIVILNYNGEKFLKKFLLIY